MTEYYTAWKNEIAAQGNAFWNSPYYQRWKQQLVRQGYQDHGQKAEQSWQEVRVHYQTHPLTEQQQKDRRVFYSGLSSVLESGASPMACLFCGHVSVTRRVVDKVTVPCCSVCHGCILDLSHEALFHHLTRILSFQIANSLTCGNVPEYIVRLVPVTVAGPKPFAANHPDHPFQQPECECVVCGIPRRQAFLVSLRLAQTQCQVPCCVLCKHMIAQMPVGQFLRWTVICHERLTELSESDTLQGSTLKDKVHYLVNWLGTFETGMNNS